MTVKEIEQKLLEYVELQETYNHRKNALEEFDKVREKFTLDEISHIGFIINDYPEYDHFLIKLSNENSFIHLGFSKTYLKSLSKKDIHKVAKAICKFFKGAR